MLFLNHPSIYHHHRRKQRQWSVTFAVAVIKWFILITFSDNTSNGKSMLLCDAAPSSLVLPPSPSPSLLPFGENIEQHVALQSVAEANRVVNLTRQHGGDVFKAYGKIIFYPIIISYETSIYV